LSSTVADRLYYHAQDQTEFSAVVTDIRLERRDGATGNRWQIALDRTAFYPESGGQPWDLGRLEAVARSGARLEVPVLAVVEDETGEIWHVVEKPLTAGTEITGAIDPARRRDHMQQHTGQHLLSAVFLRELNAPTISFHLGAESSTIDLAVLNLTPEEIVRVEEAANALIAADRAVSITTVDRQEAEAMLTRGDLRKLPDRTGPIRVVEIAGVEWNACGGTHVASTGAIGGITLRRVERIKQFTRVEFTCGLRAIRTARKDYEILVELGRLLSTGSPELPAKAEALLEEARAAEKTRRALREELASLEAASLAGQGTIIEATARDVSYAKLLASRIAALEGPRIALVNAVEGDRATIVLASSPSVGIDCGAIMKAALFTLNARGGGSPTMAQGGVPVIDKDQLLADLRQRIIDTRKPTAL
jgi:alanyl-tRNA synthetase